MALTRITHISAIILCAELIVALFAPLIFSAGPQHMWQSTAIFGEDCDLHLMQLEVVNATAEDRETILADFDALLSINGSGSTVLAHLEAVQSSIEKGVVFLKENPTDIEVMARLANAFGLLFRLAERYHAYSENAASIEAYINYSVQRFLDLTPNISDHTDRNEILLQFVHRSLRKNLRWFGSVKQILIQVMRLAPVEIEMRSAVVAALQEYCETPSLSSEEGFEALNIVFNQVRNEKANRVIQESLINCTYVLGFRSILTPRQVELAFRVYGASGSFSEDHRLLMEGLYKRLVRVGF